MKLHAAMLAFCLMGLATPALAKTASSAEAAAITVTGPDGASARYEFKPDGRFEMRGEGGERLEGAWRVEAGRVALETADADETLDVSGLGSVAFRVEAAS